MSPHFYNNMHVIGNTVYLHVYTCAHGSDDACTHVFAILTWHMTQYSQAIVQSD